MTEEIGFKDAPITMGIGVGIMNKSVRDCTRVMIDDKEAAAFLTKFLMNCIPLCYEGMYIE